MRLGEAIYLWRKRRELSQEQLAEISGVSRNYISLLERGSFCNPTLEQLEKIANAMELEIIISFHSRRLQDNPILKDPEIQTMNHKMAQRFHEIADLFENHAEKNESEIFISKEELLDGIENA